MMKAVELEKAYNPKDFEDRIYSEWKEKGEFAPKDGEGHFSVVMPPPNVTGVLHMGHALNNNLQDIIVRYKRMKGFPTLWVPGTDHGNRNAERRRETAGEGRPETSGHRTREVPREDMACQGEAPRYHKESA